MVMQILTSIFHLKLEHFKYQSYEKLKNEKKVK